MMAQWGPKLGSQSTDRQASHFTATEQCSCRFRHRRCTSQRKSLASESHLARPAESAPGARARLSVRVANLEAVIGGSHRWPDSWGVLEFGLSHLKAKGLAGARSGLTASQYMNLHYHCLLLDARPFLCLPSATPLRLLLSLFIIGNGLCVRLLTHP